MSNLIRTKYISLPAIALATFSFLSPVAYAEKRDAAPDQGVCDTSFILMDSDDDAMIDKAEATDAQQKVFGFLDRNGDSIISRDEYAECVTGTKYHPAAYYKTRTEANFAAIDTNSDGKISRFEFLMTGKTRYEDAYGKNKGKMPVAVYNAGMETLVAGNPYVDRNEDGNVSPSEAVNDVDNTFAEIDVNANGEITLQEWKVSMPAAHLRAYSSYDAMDTNKDGRVDAAEYNAYWVKSHKGIGEKPMTVWDYRAQRYYSR